MKFRLPLPTASTVNTPNAVRKLNRQCFFLSLKRQVNSNPTTCSYIPKDHEKRSSTVSHWLKVLTTVTCHKFSPTDYRLPAAFCLSIDYMPICLLASALCKHPTTTRAQGINTDNNALKLGVKSRLLGD